MTDLELISNFLLNIMIFVGGFYVAMHSRVLPRWTVTCIWYIGLASLFTCITVVLQWVYGPSFPMSYGNVRLLCDMVTHGILAIAVVMLFVHTVFKNRKHKKHSNYLKGVNLNPDTEI